VPIQVRPPPVKRILGPRAERVVVSQIEQVYRSHERYIQMHPRFDLIVMSLREGIALREIAGFFAENGWIEIAEKSFLQYLTTFKRRNPSMWRPKVNTDRLGEESERNKIDTIDDLVDGNQPLADPALELSRLVRLQKRRLAMSVKNEIAMGGVLMQITNDAVNGTRKVLESYAKVQNRGGFAHQPGAEGVSPGVADELKRVQNDEGKRAKLTHLANSLLQVVTDADREKVSA
jgi:hypothetical protein